MRYLTMWMLGLLLAVSSTALSQVRLEHKVHEGESLKTTATSNIDQTLTIAGMAIPTTVESRTVSKSSAGKRDASGKVRVQEKIESLNVNMSAQGAQYTFDSANPDNAGTSPLEVLRGVHKAVAKHVSTIVYDKENNVEVVETDQNLIGSLPVEMQQLVKSQLDPENLKKSAQQELQRLPDDPVKTGDTWVRTETVNFGAGQEMTFQTEYKYEGTVEKDGRKLDKITSKPLSVTFALQADSPLPLKVKGSELKATGKENVFLFDREKGYIVQSNGDMTVSGSITFEVNGMELPSTLDLTIKSTSTVEKG